MIKKYTIEATAIEWHCAMMACKIAFDSMSQVVPDAPSVGMTQIIGKRIAELLKETSVNWSDEEKKEMQEFADREYAIVERLKKQAKAEQTDGSEAVN